MTFFDLKEMLNSLYPIMTETKVISFVIEVESENVRHIIGYPIGEKENENPKAHRNPRQESSS